MNNCYREKDSSFQTCFYAGISYYALEDFYPAHDLLERALKDDNTNINVLYYLGRACSKTSWKEDGVTYLETAVSLAMPSDSVMSRLYVGLADCYKMAFQYTDQANTLLTQYEKYDRQKHRLLYDAAFIYYYYLKDASKAERYLTAYLKTRPKNSKDKVQEVDADGVPIIGATVIVKGTTVGTSTGADGSFALEIPAPAAKAVLSFGYLGYDDTEIPVGSRTAMEVTLRESALEMDAVVVTALGIKRSEKALSYNVQQVSAEEIVGNKDVNFVNALSGKVAGVNINASSSGVGGASKVVMRGTKGIDQSSNALYVIDGVPMYNLGGEGGTEFDSAGTSEAVADINPEDIESVSVLTGAAAAALYGSYASNGAIVITTKKGKAGHTSVTVTSNTEVHSAPFR